MRPAAPPLSAGVLPVMGYSWLAYLRYSRISLASLGDHGRVDVVHAQARVDHLALALGAVVLRERDLNPELGAHRCSPRQQAVDRVAGRVALALEQVEQFAVEPVADRAPHVLLDHPPREIDVRHPF